MADDITLTVRVRDMTRGDFNRINGQMQRMRQSMQGVNRTTSSGGRNAQLLGRDMSQLSARLTQMSRNGRLTRRELDSMNNTLTVMSRTARNAARSGEITRSSFRSLRSEIARMRAELRLIGGDGNVFQRLSDRVLLFQNRLRQTNTHAGTLRRSLNRMGDGAAHGLRGALAGTILLTSAMRRLGSIININKRWTAILIAALVLIGPIAAALGALLTAVLGGAFIALGALALKNSTTVKAAFRDMKDSVAADVRAAAEPMEGQLSEGIRSVGKAVSQMQPMLKSAFTATGPLIDDFIGAFTDLAGMSLPGITSALQGLGPAMEGFRTAMGLVGKGIGDMFAAMTAGGGAEALKSVWITLGVELNNLLVGVGEFVNAMAQSEGATMLMIGVFRSLSGVLNIVAAAMTLVDTSFGGLLGNLASGVTGMSALEGLGSGVADSFKYQGKSAGELKKELAKVNAEIKDIQKDTKGKWYEFGLDDRGEQQDRGYEQLKAKRTALTNAIALAEAGAADKTNQHTTAVKSLAQAIKDLNNQNIGRLDAKSAMEKAIDDAAAKANELKGKVSIKGGVIDLDTEAGRQAHEVLSNIAKTTAEYVEKLQEAKAPQADINAAWGRGREQLVGMAGSLGVSKAQMEDYANMVLRTPKSVRTQLKVEKQQAEEAVATAIAKIKKVPKEQKSRVTLEAQRAMERASMVSSQLDALDGKTANTYITNTIRTINQIITTTKYRSVHEIVGATGGLASNLKPKKFATGGSISGGVLEGPGTKTSDSLLARLSKGEFVMRAAAVDKYGPAFMELINSGRFKKPPGFKKGGMSSTMKEARKELADAAQISYFGTKAGYKRTPLTKSIAAPADMGALTSALNGMRGDIKRAFSGKTESKLLKQLTSAGKSLISYQKKLTTVNKALDKAKESLADLKSEAKQLKETVKSGLLTEANITKGASAEDSQVTINTLLSNMTASAANTKQFDSMLKQLKAKGLSGDLIAQIGEAGIANGGMETAAAILGGGSSEIKRLNELQQQIGASAASAGKVTADAMYGAGIKAAEGLVKGLTAQQDKIEAAMMKIAKAMEKSIKKALGIKSPSKVMMDVGHNTAEGFALGVEKNRKVDHSWMSMLDRPRNAPAGKYRAGGGSGPGGGPMIVQINLGGKNVGELLIDPLRKSISHRGGDVQAVLGKS